MASTFLALLTFLAPAQSGGQAQAARPAVMAEDFAFEDDVWSYTGNVEATYEDLRVEADWATYNVITGELEAGDVVTLTRGEETLTGRGLRLNLNTKTGELVQVSARVPGYLVQAARARRLEDGRYEFTDAVLTSCDEEGNPTGWNLETKRVTLDPDVSRVQASHSVLTFQGVPFFYLPWVRTSVEQNRSSGFLTPQTSTSTTKGRSIRLPFYYAVNRSMDVRLTGEYFSKRGFGGGVLFRAVPNERSRIEIDNLFARDRQGAGGQRTDVLAYTQQGNVRAVADMDITSSFLFRRVFEDGFDVISSPIERSRAFATYAGREATYNVFYGKQVTFFTAEPSTTLRKFPSAEVSLHSRPIGDTSMYFSLDGSVSGIHRRDAALESPGMVGRFDLWPQLEVPVLRGAAASWSHQVSLRETLYSHSASGTEAAPHNRLAFVYGFQFAGPQLEKEIGAWKHTFEPQIDYRYVTGVDDFEDTLLVDEVDLFTNTNEVRYGIVNRLFRDREIVSWSVAQKYFVDPTFGGAFVEGRDNILEPLLDLTGFGSADQLRRFSPLVSNLRVWPSRAANANLRLDYDTKRKQFRSAGLIAQYRLGLSSYNVAYFVTRSSLAFPETRNQVRAALGFGNPNRVGFNASVRVSYDIDESLFQSTTALISYNTECYGLHLQFTQYAVGTRKESRIRFSFSLTNLGSIGTLNSPDQLF